MGIKPLCYRPIRNFVSLEDALSETIPGRISDISTATRWVVPIVSGCSSLPPFTSPPQQLQHDVLLCRSVRQQHQHTTITTIKQPIRNTRSPITMYNVLSPVVVPLKYAILSQSDILFSRKWRKTQFLSKIYYKKVWRGCLMRLIIFESVENIVLTLLKPYLYQDFWKVWKIGPVFCHF